MITSILAHLRRQWPLVVMILLVVLFSLMLLFSRKAPIISGIEPSMAAPGEAVTLTGEYFGRTAREGQLTLGGVTPPPSLIREWTDQRIVFQVPEDAPSGLVAVANSQGTSDSVLFTNTLTIPTVLKTRVVQTPIEATSIVPAVPVPGQLVTISGRGLGHGEAGSWLEIAASSAPGEPLSLRLMPVQTRQWTNQQISFVLPSGWGLSAVLVIHTPRGESPTIPLQSIGPLSFGPPRERTLEWNYDVVIEKGKGILRLVAPVPDAQLGTRWTDAGEEPLLLVNPPAGRHTGTRRVKVVTAAKLWNGFSAGQIIPDDVAIPPDEKMVFGPSWKPAQTALKALSARWNLEVADPFLKVKRLLESLRAAYRQGPAGLDNVMDSPLTAAAVSQGAALSPWAAAGVTLIVAQQNGLSARLVSGFLLGETSVATHTWVQIWIPGASWVDFDPWLLLGMPAEDWDRGLGSLGAEHVAWSLGKGSEGRRLVQSRPVSGSTPYGGTSLIAEVSGDLVITAPTWQVREVPGAKAP